MENRSNLHHLVLGQLKDFLTQTELTDTYDERYRQKIAKHLVSKGKFDKKQIQTRVPLEIVSGQRKAVIKIDFLVKFQEKIVLLIKYAPGSIVTRRLSTIAISRIITPYQIPFAVVTNGEDAEVMDGNTGKVIETGMSNLPDKNFIKDNLASFLFTPIQEKKFDQASKIAFACEIDGACPCDSDICIIE